MGKWADSAEALTDEEEADLFRLSTRPSSKLTLTEANTLSELSMRKTHSSRREFIRWLSEDEQVNRCLRLDRADFDKATLVIEHLATFDRAASLSERPAQDALKRTISLVYNKLLPLSNIIVRMEAIETRLDNVLEAARDVWVGMSALRTEWTIRGEFYQFETIRELRSLRGRARSVLYSARKLHELLRDAHTMISRQVSLRQQELDLGE